MTLREYEELRKLIENRFRQDMAALERVYYIINGLNPPDSVVQLEPKEPAPEITKRQRELGELMEDVEQKPRKVWSPEARARSAQRKRERLEAKRAEMNGQPTPSTESTGA